MCSICSYLEDWHRYHTRFAVTCMFLHLWPNGYDQVQNLSISKASCAQGKTTRFSCVSPCCSFVIESVSYVFFGCHQFRLLLFIGFHCFFLLALLFICFLWFSVVFSSFFLLVFYFKMKLILIIELSYILDKFRNL